MSGNDERGEEYELATPLPQRLAPPRPQRNLYCLDCGYNLRGATSHECPECGRTFDPSNPRTFADERRRSLRFRVSRDLLFRAALVAILYAGWRAVFYTSYLTLWCVAIFVFPFWVALLAYTTMRLFPDHWFDSLPAHLLVGAIIGFAATYSVADFPLLLAYGAAAGGVAGLVRRRETVG